MRICSPKTFNWYVLYKEVYLYGTGEKTAVEVETRIWKAGKRVKKGQTRKKKEKRKETQKKKQSRRNERVTQGAAGSLEPSTLSNPAHPPTTWCFYLKPTLVMGG